MSTRYQDDDHPDDSPTDELPVLSEMDVVEDFERTSVFVALEDTGRHATLRFRAPADWDVGDQDTAAQRNPAADALSRHVGAVPDGDDTAATANRFAAMPAAESLEERLAELRARLSASDAATADKDATIASLEERLEATRRAVVRRDETEQQLRSALAERELRIAELGAGAADIATRLTEQEIGLSLREESLAERESALSERGRLLSEQEAAFALRQTTLEERERLFTAKDAELAEREAGIVLRDRRLAEQVAAVALREHELAERERTLEAREAELHEREDRSSRLETELGERAARLTLRDAGLTEQQAELARSDAALRQQEAEWSRRATLMEEREARVTECETALEELEAELAVREQAVIACETVPRESGIPAEESVQSEGGGPGGERGADAGLHSRINELLELNESLRGQLDVLGAALPAEATAGGTAAASSSEEAAAHASAGGAASSSERVDSREHRDLLHALRRSREEAAALADYIDGRRGHWASMEATLAEQNERIEELDRELEQRAERQRQAESVADEQTQRVASLKTEIARLRILTEGRYPERHSERGPERDRVPGIEFAHAPMPAQAATREHARQAQPLSGEESSWLPSELSSAVIAAPQPPPDAFALAPPRDSLASPAAPAAATAAETPPGEAAPSLRESAMSDPAARILRDGDEDPDEDEHAERERRLNESETQLEVTRAALRRLERLLIERDRAMDIKNARIDALQAELQIKLDAAPLENGAPQGESMRGGREAGAGAAAGTTPTMICLTGEAPRAFPLHKRVVTIGRSAECDLQVATHFVSREHARLTVAPDGVFIIEDLGSKNGVFVNAVRVERERLRHGDLVTVGETQFRFVTS